jgi:hypothetical protein
MAKTRTIDTPLNELVLRKYEKPYNLKKRELVRKLCLSLGLLQPGDSRDVVVDVLYVFLLAQSKKELISSEEVRRRVEKIRKDEKLQMLGIASSNIRRQILRLRDLLIVEKVKNKYRIIEFNSLSENFENKIEKVLLPDILERLKMYLKELDKEFYSEEKQKK